MPATVESSKSDIAALAGGREQSFETKEFISEPEREESVVSDGGLFAISRFFVGQGLRCLNLPLETPDIEGVIDYLYRNPEANWMVELTFEALRDFFSEPVRLEVYPDPEGERERELALFVETTDESGEALRKLDEFDAAFWLGHVEQFGHYLSVHIDYQ